MLRRYWTWRATSWSERGGRKEKVSKNLRRRREVGGQRRFAGAHEGCGNEKKKLADFLCGAKTPRIGVHREKLSDAGRRPPHAMRPTSVVASRDYGRAPKYRPRPNRESRVGERPSRSEGGARIACCRGVVDRTERKRMIDARARRARVRASRRRAPGGEYRSGYTWSRSAPGASPRVPVVVAERRLRRLRATTGKDQGDFGDRSDLRAVLTCCRGAATPSWSWCWRPCRWRPRGPC